MIEKATVKIWRFDPAVDKQPRYEVYHLPPGNWDRVKVIDALRYIFENYDPGIAFREPCRQGYCKACAVKVNNKVRLACQVFLEEETIIEPAPNRTIIKDIVTT